MLYINCKDNTQNIGYKEKCPLLSDRINKNALFPFHNKSKRVDCIFSEFLQKTEGIFLKKEKEKKKKRVGMVGSKTEPRLQ